MHGWNIKLASAIGFSVAMALCVAFFLIIVPSGGNWWQAWIAGIFSILASIPVGWWLGYWYIPVHKAHPLFRYFVCPIAALVLSLLTGLTIYMLWAVALGQSGPEYDSFMLYILGYGAGLLIVTTAFLSVAWPLALISFGAVGVWLVKYSKTAPNKSFKRTAGPKYD
jgi:hypothetical protein